MLEVREKMKATLTLITTTKTCQVTVTAVVMEDHTHQIRTVN